MNEPASQVIQGDCLSELTRIGNGTVDLVYLDPPFFTNKRHSAITRDRAKKFSFTDVWDGLSEYAQFMEARLRQVHRILRDTGSIFVHCDSSANFLLRGLLDEVFGKDQFRSEIIWAYRRWSNSARSLMPSHQTIFFYSKTPEYKFHRVYSTYSETTNVDQILQLRARDEYGVSKYAMDRDGNVVFGEEKKGVPLSDVWEIPFLNPKAKERAGYPTQKPVLLLERIIEISTNRGDLVVDPFCGSGTTLVAATLLGRRSLGIDCSAEAADLARRRLKEPHKTESALLKKGRAAYLNADVVALGILAGLDLIPVHRNAGIDAFLKTPVCGSLVPIRVQRSSETLADAASMLWRAAKSKKAALAILVRTGEDKDIFGPASLPVEIKIVDAAAVQVKQQVSDLLEGFETKMAANTALHTDTPKAARR
ncbi:MAG: site-specific DNA-methyltransferase [Nitrososphaera sp.]|nr:site-specific DNA-methyltransferase [Nitrososphaera sp.]